ncbi:asparaginase [Achromobacter aloeverae]|uniref:L-asparaginase n=1 Tax=Achromobacter aloeverae TaxID=1750518 RepID=A0A4Q1HM75_9BURK|nr:asparaginase [Achromobacter aloeverae]RXN91601.1 L-asparaginase [Achromobacter aloeverae]
MSALERDPALDGLSMSDNFVPWRFRGRSSGTQFFEVHSPMSVKPFETRQPLPRVALFAVGGTIAGRADNRTNTTDYKIGSIGARDLIAAVPELAEIAEVSGEQIANVPSSDVGAEVLLKLAKAISAKLDDPRVKGVVVTHGTDTLAESAFFIDLTVRTTKPVVFVGAMRPASAISADGPGNLLQAVALAASDEAVGRGTLLTLNDRIGSAFYINKTHTTALDTFHAYEQGYLGTYINARPRFWYTPATPIGKPHFDISAMESLPKVPILYMHQDADDALIDAAIAGGAKGLVIDASGHGSVRTSTKQRIRELDQQGFPVIRASRTNNGIVAEKPEGIGAGVYTAGKARWLLSLAIAAGASIDEIRRCFRA